MPDTNDCGRTRILAEPDSRFTHLLGTITEIAKMTLQFGRVNRVTRHPDGKRPETDTDHTVMLGVIACYLAHMRMPPQLDIGRISELALVHDLVECRAGDTDTRRALTSKQIAEKKEREEAAFAWIAGHFGVRSWLSQRIAEYETLSSPEARFVKVVDKILPKLTHLLNNKAVIRDMDPDELQAVDGKQRGEIALWASEWPWLIDLYDQALLTLFPDHPNLQKQP